MIRQQSTNRACQRRSERGLTLIEAVVSIALLAMVGSIVGAAYSVGLKALGTGGAGDRLAGAHDQMVFEQQLGQDVTRASCVQVPPGPKYGSCSNGFANSSIASRCAGAALCVGWAQVSDSSCHVAAYTSSSNKYRRTEYSVATSGMVTAVGSVGITTDTVDVVISPPEITTAPSGYPWVASLTVAVTNTGVTRGQPTDTLKLHPIASDPAGSAAATITPSGPPC